MRKKAPEGRVNWTDKTFERLRDAAPETLTSQFQVTTTMVLNLMERDGEPVAAMADLLSRVHGSQAERRRHVRRAIKIYQSLRTAGGLSTSPAPSPNGTAVRACAWQWICPGISPSISRWRLSPWRPWIC